MKIGLLSDSHGLVAVTRRAVKTLLDAGAEVLIHLGDIGGVEVIDTLVGTAVGDGSDPDPITGRTNGCRRPVEVHLVFGNTDDDLTAMTRYARSLGIQVDHPVGILQLADSQQTPHVTSTDRPAARQLVFLHGHDQRAMVRALEDRVSYLCHGHSHERRDHRSGTTRIINPGALCRASVYSVALLETQTDRLTFYEISKG